MKYKRILITGGAGFVGSNLALKFKKDYPHCEIISLDNLNRKGSELNLPRLKEAGIIFVKGDVRNIKDIESVGNFDLLIECSAECSVLAGYKDSARYLIDTNLVGAVNCLEAAKDNKADFIFLSTSRVYPIEVLRSIKLVEQNTRFEVSSKQKIKGISKKGISEQFPLGGHRSFYGTTKLSAELLIQEYINGYGMRGVINRCGVIAGPWQMGKIDQGVLALWVARHIYRGKLSYIGFGGRQVRDILHVDDLYELIILETKKMKNCSGKIYNIGGGVNNSVSLLELTDICRKITGNKIKINKINKVRLADIPYYVSDCSKVKKDLGWFPKKDLNKTASDILDWISRNKKDLYNIFK